MADRASIPGPVRDDPDPSVGNYPTRYRPPDRLPRTIVEQWTLEAVAPIVTVEFFGIQVGLTGELPRVSGG